MRLELTILTATLVLAPIVSGYSCYDQGGSKSCDSKDDLHKYREDYCGSDRWKTGGSYSKGRSKISVSGHYHDQKSCYDRFQGVIDECYGKKNGGRVSDFAYLFHADSRMNANASSVFRTATRIVETRPTWIGAGVIENILCGW